MSKWINDKVESVINQGLSDYKKSGIGFGELEKFSDFFLGPVFFHGGPNSFADNNYLENKITVSIWGV